MILVKSGSPVDATPTGDGSAYNADSDFESGTDLGSGNYVVYKGTGTNEDVTNLTNGINYYFRAFVRYGSDWTDSDEYESVNAATYATFQDANRKIRLTEKVEDDLVAGSNKCFIVDVEFLDKYGDVTGDINTSVSFNAWLNAAGTTAGNGVLTKMKRTTSGSTQTFELKYTKAEPIYLEAVAGSIDSVGQTGDNFPATVTAADPANIHVSLSKAEFTVDEYTRMDITVVDAYSNAVDDSEEVWFDLGGRGLISENTPREAISEPVSLDADGKGKVYYHPSWYYTGSQDIIVYWDGNNDGADDGHTGESAVVETKSVTINPEELAQVVLEVTGSAQGLTGEVNQVATDTVGTTTGLLAELQDIYGNHIDATSTSDISWSFGDSTVTNKVDNVELDSDKSITAGFEVSHVIRSVNNVDSVTINTTGGYTSTVEITQFSAGPYDFTVGTDTAYTTANDSILIAGRTNSDPDSIIYFGLRDEYGNTVDDTYEITYSTNGDGKFANGKSDITVAVGTAGTTGSGLEFFAGTVAGSQKITATYGSISDDFTINVLPAAPDSVSLLPESITGLVADSESEKLIAYVFDVYGNSTFAGDTLFNAAPTFALEDTGSSEYVGLGTLTTLDTTISGNHYVKYLADDSGKDSASIIVDLGAGTSSRYDTTSILCIENTAIDTFNVVSSEMTFDTTTVGDWKTVSFEAYDINGNKKYNYEDTVTVTLNNSDGTGNQVIWEDGTAGGLAAADKDTALSVEAYFTDGKMNLKLYHELADSGLTITLEDAANAISLTTGEFGFKPDIVDSLSIKILTADVYAGENFDCSVTPIDEYGNENSTEEITFYLTSKDPYVVDIASNKRFITGAFTYNINARKIYTGQYLQYYDATVVGGATIDKPIGVSATFNILVADNDAPLLTVTKPVEGLFQADSVLIVTGTVTDASEFYLIVNGDTTIVTDDAFSTTVNFSIYEGDTTVVVKAVDVRDNEATTTVNITIDTTGPVFDNWTPVNLAEITEQKPVISVDVTDALAGVDTSAINMKVDDGIVVATLTAITDGYNVAYTPVAYLKVGLHTVTIEAADIVGNIAYDTTSFTIIGVETKEIVLAAGYNLVSISVDPVDATTLGSIFLNKVAIQGYDGSGYVDYTDTTLVPGMAFWVASSAADTVDVVGYDVNEYTLDVVTGFNLVGALAATASFTDFEDPEGVLVSGWLYEYNAATKAYEAATTLEPGKGYWVAATDTGTIELGAALLAKANAASVPMPEWVGRITVNDNIYSFGKAEAAVSAFDSYDVLMPPVAPGSENNSSYFENNNSAMFSRYLADVRSEAGKWLFHIANGQKARFDVSNIPAKFDVVTNIDGKQINLRKDNTIAASKAISIEVGKGLLLPEKFVLYRNYPNPFNPTTFINYELPKETFVNITIYDITGRIVRKLVNEKQNAGYKSVLWDGRDNNGQLVSSGFYLYYMKAEGFNKVKKMTFLK